MEAVNLVELIKRSGLVDEQQLDNFLQQHPGWQSDEGSEHWVEQQLDGFFHRYRGSPSAKTLAHRLVAAELLTHWQALKLLDGRHKGFFLSHYKLLRHLATGGTTSIYLADDPIQNRQVAIKVLPLNRADNPKYVERFRLQATIGSQLDEVTTIQIYELSQEGSLHFMALEYIPGGSLAELVAQEGPLSYRVAVIYVQQTALWLERLHERGWLHRDLRPEALLLKGSIIKVVGCEHPIAHDLEYATHALDHAEAARIADYMAPEHANVDALVDHRADLYSLGCVLYFLLTGEPPFPRGTLARRLVAHRQQPPPDLGQHPTYFPPALIHACERLLAKNPADRFQSATEVYRALLRVFKHE